MEFRKGIAVIFIVIIAGGALLTSGGSYAGVRHYQSQKYEKQADLLLIEGRYSEALSLYDKSISRWRNKSAKSKRATAEKEKNALSVLEGGKSASSQSNWQECIERLSGVASDTESYNEAQRVISECKGKIEDTTKTAPEEVAQANGSTSNEKKIASSVQNPSSSEASSNTEPTSPDSQPTPEPQSPTPAPNSSSSECQNNAHPVFTSHITDLSQVTNIAIPPRIIGGDLKTHSYINSEHRRVPIYAPVSAKLTNGVFLSHGSDPSDYGLTFQVSCQVRFRLGHITDPVQAIKDIFGPTPVSDSRYGTNINPPLSFSAGQLIGYTTGTAAAGNWDFGVYNSSTSNKYASDPDWNWSSFYTTAVCPYDYFSSGLKSSYSSKYIQDFGVSTHDGEFFCQ